MNKKFGEVYSQSLKNISLSSDFEENLYSSLKEEKTMKTNKRKFRFVPAMAAALVLCGVSVTAYAISETEVFKNFFTEKTEVYENYNDFRYMMDLDKLENISTGEYKNVIDNEEISLDITGIIGDKNKAFVTMVLTDKRFEKIDRENVFYNIHMSDVDMSNGEIVGSGTEIIDSSDLADNQIRLLYTMHNNTSQINNKTYELFLTEMNISKNISSEIVIDENIEMNNENNEFVIVNDNVSEGISNEFLSVNDEISEEISEEIVINETGDWKFNLTFEYEELSERLEISNQKYLNSELDITLSPFCCTLNFGKGSENQAMKKHYSDFKINMKDGGAIDYSDKRMIYIEGSGATMLENGGLNCLYEFAVPIDISQVESVEFDGVIYNVS